MKHIINTDEEMCRGCASCIRVCPIKDANIAHMCGDKLRVSIDSKKCIACGACLKACPHGVRSYNDDTELFFNNLNNGVPVALVVAPAFKENFVNWGSILAWLKTKGATTIVDVSLGIEICTWAHLRYIEQYNPSTLIPQPCPPIVGYIEKHCPQLVSKVSPVQSPIVCTSVYLKNPMGLPEKIAALTPCPAKTNEFSEVTTVDYNVTFKKLADYITAHNISVPPADFIFDHIAVASGKAMTTPGSLTKSVRRVIGCINLFNLKIKIDTIKSRYNVYRYLDLISKEKSEDCPLLLEALNCIGGCSFGAGCNTDKPEPVAEHQEVETGRDSERANLFSVFDHTLKLSDYIKQ